MSAHDLTRRSFLGFITALIPATIIAPLWAQTETAKVQLAPDALVGLHDITAALADELRTILPPGAVVPVMTSSLRHQVTVNFLAPGHLDHHGLDRERYLRPVAYQLAHSIRKMGGGAQYGQLPVPPAVYRGCVVTIDGLALRGVMQYDISIGGNLLQFDILTN